VTPAKYSVIRYIPDPGRNEALNVGIVLWTDAELAVELDGQAIERVVRENPHLAKDALRGLADELRAELTSGGASPEDCVRRWLAAQRGFPVAPTEGRLTTLAADSREAFQATLDRLLARVVRPKRRSGGGGFDVARAVERSLQPLLSSQRVFRDYAFTSSRSGVSRSVDYFANSGANVALDLVKLDITRADEIRRRADAEAFKIEDIRSTNNIEIVVLCSLNNDEALAQVNRDAQRIIGSVGARITTDAEEASRVIQAAVE
jgi:hypothetical protein